MDKHEKMKINQREDTGKYSNSPPSQVNQIYWLYAVRKEGNYPTSDIQFSGKWLIFVNKEEIDSVWSQIKEATENGKLGGSSKVATAKENPNATSPNQKVICVYTYNWEDEIDVRKIREELRKLGITQKIPYKADKDTLEGKYAKRGHKKISKYYE